MASVMTPNFAQNSGATFIHFGFVHLAILGMVGLFIFSLFFVRKSANTKLCKLIRYSLAGLLIINQLARHIWLIYFDMWNIQWNLPLHLCSIFVWLSAYMLITKSYTIFEFAYFLGLGGALQALLTPDVGSYSFQKLYLAQFFIAHGSIIIASAYMAIVEGYRPTWASIRKVFIWANIYLVIVTVINLVIGSNYLYTLHKPNVPTLLDYLGPWPWYILSAEGIALILFLLLYLPFLLSAPRPSQNSITDPKLYKAN